MSAESYLGAPRFVVTSVSGYADSHGGSGSARYVTSYQILDRPYCYELVWETYRRANAERIARELNERDGFSPYLKKRSADRVYQREREARFRRFR